MRITFDGSGDSAYRSQLEREVAAELDRLDVAYSYELAVTLPDRPRIPYLPDFTIEADASHLGLPRWIECKPQQMLYTLRDVTGVTRRAGEYFKTDVNVEGLKAQDLMVREMEELAKPKRLAELSGDDVLLVGGVQGTSTLSVLLTPTGAVFSRSHVFVNQRGHERALAKAAREERWRQDAEVRQREYQERVKHEMEQRAGLRLVNAQHFVTRLSPQTPRFASSCYLCEQPGTDGGIYKARYSTGLERWERLCASCESIARSTIR